MFDAPIRTDGLNTNNLFTRSAKSGLIPTG